MWEYIVKRVIKEGEYIACHGATVRAAAKAFGVSKSTVHKDITERLESVDSALCAEVRRLLELNKAERHIRGGLATRQKYQTASGGRGRAERGGAVQQSCAEGNATSGDTR